MICWEREVARCSGGEGEELLNIDIVEEGAFLRLSREGGRTPFMFCSSSMITLIAQKVLTQSENSLCSSGNGNSILLGELQKFMVRDAHAQIKQIQK